MEKIVVKNVDVPRDSKVVVLAAGETQYTCPLLMLGAFFALGRYAGRRHDGRPHIIHHPGAHRQRTSYIFPALTAGPRHREVT